MTARKGWFARTRDAIGTVNDLTTYLTACVLQHGTLAVDAVPEKFKTTTVLYWRRGGIQFSKAATTAIVFTASHVITASKYGIVLVQITDAGVISTKVPSSTQAYNTSALALAAKPAVDAGNTEVGYMIIQNNTGDWTANTDDLTAASDITAVTFTNATAATIPAAL
jgi:hypothetical protein